MVKAIQADRESAVEAFDDVCGSAYGFEEFGRQSYREEGIRILSGLFTRHRIEAAAQARREALEEAARACDDQMQAFLSPEYATGQPLSSFQERFACGQCAAAIRALSDSPPLEQEG